MLASGYVLCFLCNLDVVDSMLINRYHRCIIRNYYISLSNMNLFFFVLVCMHVFDVIPFIDI